MIKVKRLNTEFLPFSNGASAGWDLHSNENKTLIPFERHLFKTGLSFEIPEGYYGKIEGRSGLALKGIGVLGGVIDSDYRGEVGVILINHSSSKIEFNVGDRIAQIIFQPCVNSNLMLVDEIGDTERGDKGFGSSGR